jgi:hypothetical protein
MQERRSGRSGQEFVSDRSQMLSACPHFPGTLEIIHRLWSSQVQPVHERFIINPSEAVKLGIERILPKSTSASVECGEMIVERKPDRWRVGPVRPEDHRVCRVEHIGHIGKCSKGPVCGSFKIVNEDRSTDANTFLEVPGSLELLLEAGVGKVVLSRVGFPGIDKDGLHTSIGVLLDHVIERRTRQRTVWSGQ